MTAVQSKTLDFHSYFEDKQAQSRPSTGPSTRPSITFRSIGRDKDPHWSNRFRKDVNDLTYDVKYNLIKGKANMNGNMLQRYKRSLRNNNNNKRRMKESAVSQGKQSAGISLQKYKLQITRNNTIKNPQIFRIVQDKKYSTLDSQGLCKHEFQKTISGRLIHKSNHHLGFQYQTERSVNLNPVWHDPSTEITNQINIEKMLKKTKVNKSHGFTSYTERRVFEPKEQLDKFYDTDKALRLASARTIKQTCHIDGITGRKQFRPSTSSQLQYNQYQAKKKVIEKLLSYKISPIKRQLRFSRQVISPQRGCYR